MELVRNYSMTTKDLNDGYSTLRIVQVGCGGTGSYIVPSICQYISTSPLKNKTEIILIDGDIIEQKNLVRQRFIAQDLGRNKAEVLAERYSSAFGVTVKSLSEYLDVEKHRELISGNNNYYPLIVIGAVDNHNARLQIASLVSAHPHYAMCIDTGNGMWNGQVNLYTNRPFGYLNERHFSGDTRKPIPGGIISRLYIPPPMFQDFALMEKTVTDFLITDQCAVNAEANTQTINANMLSAQCAVSYLYQILSGSVDSFSLYFDAKSGTVRSLPINLTTIGAMYKYPMDNRQKYQDFKQTHRENPLFKCAEQAYSAVYGYHY